MEKKFYYLLTAEEVNLIIRGLDELPRKESNALCVKLVEEANKQLEEEAKKEEVSKESEVESYD